MVPLAELRPIQTERSPVCDPYLLLEMRNHGFITLNVALARLPRSQHIRFLAKTLEVITDQSVMDLPVVKMAEELFSLLDHARDPSRIMTMENVMIYVMHRLGMEEREENDR